MVEIDGSLIPEDTRPALAAKGAIAEPLDKPKAKATRSSDDGVIRFLRPWGLDFRDADGSTIKGLIVHSFPYAQIGFDGTDAANVQGNWLGITPAGDVAAAQVHRGPSARPLADQQRDERHRRPRRRQERDLRQRDRHRADGPGREQQPHLRQLHRHDHRRPRPPPQLRDRHPPHRAGGPRRPRHAARTGSSATSWSATATSPTASASSPPRRPRSKATSSASARPASRSRRPARRSATDIGIYVHDSPETAIGGTGPAEFNIVSGNKLGIEVNGGSDRSTIAGNRIGTDYDGKSAAPNTNGVAVVGDGLDEAPADITVNDNTIAGSTNYGMYITGGAKRPTLTNNRFGTDIDGVKKLPNKIGFATGAPASGGAAPTDLTFGPGNVVAGNRTDGVQMFGPSAVVQGQPDRRERRHQAARQRHRRPQRPGRRRARGEQHGLRERPGHRGHRPDRQRPCPRQPRRHRAQRRGHAIDFGNAGAGVLVLGTAPDAPTNTRIGGSSSTDANLISGNARGVQVQGDADGHGDPPERHRPRQRRTRTRSRTTSASPSPAARTPWSAARSASTRATTSRATTTPASASTAPRSP